MAFQGQWQNSGLSAGLRAIVTRKEYRQPIPLLQFWRLLSASKRGRQLGAARPNQSQVPFLAKAMIRHHAASRRGTIGVFAKPSKSEARCRWRRKLGAANSGERAGRGSGSSGRGLPGDMGIGLAFFPIGSP